MINFDHSFLGLRRMAVKDKFQINQASTISVSGVPFWVYLYKTYCAKPLLRKHYKEGASVVTHFWVPTKYIYKDIYIFSHRRLEK